MEQNMITDYIVKRYDSVEDIFLASMDGAGLTKEELPELTIECYNSEDASRVDVDWSLYLSSIKEQGIYGFVEGDNIIHLWIGKDLPMADLIHFFAHEIGHNTGKKYKDTYKEEVKAESYGIVAELAFKLAEVEKLK